MKRRTTTETRPRPMLPRIPEEMRQWSDLLLHEISGWADVSSKPMFGMKAVYQDKAIFGVLPRTRAMDTAYSVSFKIPRRNIALSKSLNADPRILLGTREAKWISFELQSGDDLAGAIRWFGRASRLAEKARKSS
jgi:hypothetical protein